MLSMIYHRSRGDGSPISVALLGVLLAASAVDVSAQATIASGGLAHVNRLWETLIEEDSFEVEYKACAVSPKDDSVWLVLGRRPALMMTGPQTLALRVLDRAGKTLSEKSLESLAKSAGLSPAPDQFIDIAAMLDGTMAILFSSGGQLSVVTVDGRHRVTQGRNIGALRPELFITRAQPTPAGNLLLLGRLGDRAIAIKLDQNLSVRWEKMTSPEDASLFLDGALFGDESFTLIGARSRGSGASTEIMLWLGQIDREGQIKNSLSLPGRFPSLAASPDGACAIVAADATSQGLDFWFKIYDRNLKELWNSKLVSGTRDFQPFRLSYLSQTTSDFFIVGSLKRHLWLSRVHAGTALLWSDTLTEQSGSMPELVWNFGLKPSTRGMVIPYTDMVVNKKMQQRQVVKVMVVDTH